MLQRDFIGIEQMVVKQEVIPERHPGFFRRLLGQMMQDVSRLTIRAAE